MRNGDFVTYDDIQAGMLRRARLTELDTNDPTLYVETRGRGKVRVHTQRRYWIDAQGQRRKIRNHLERQDRAAGEFSLRNNTNTIKTEVKSEGEVWYRVGPYGLRVRLARAARENNSGQDQGGEDATRGTTENPEPNKARVTNALGSNLTFDYEVQPGGVKEYITVAAKPDLTNATRWAIIWDWQTLGLTPVVRNKRVVWYSSEEVNGETVNTPRLVFKPLIVWDANGTEYPAQYRVRDNGNGTGKLAVVMRASDMDAAAYPVTIDPTIETDEDEYGARLTLRDTAYSGSHAYEDAYQAFTLPSLPGATITGGNVHYFNNRAITTVADVDFDVYAAVVASWSTSTSLGDMQTIGGTMGSAILTTQNPGSAANFGQTTLNIGSAIVGAYTDGIPDGLLTVRWNWTGVEDHGAPTPNSVYADQFRIGDSGSAAGFFESRQTADHYPYIEITYTAPSLSTANASDSVSVGEDDYDGGTNNLGSLYAMAKFTLPDMTGNTVLGGRVYMKVSSPSGVPTWEVRARHTATSWSSAGSTASALASIASTETGSALHTGQTKQEDEEWTSWDITGSVAGTNGILYAYDQAASVITVVLTCEGPWSDVEPVVDSKDAGVLLMNDETGANFVFFHSHSAAEANRPYIEVFYESAGGGPVQRRVGPSVGVLSA